MAEFKTVKQIIHDNDKLMKLRNSEEEVFALLFRKVVHDKTLSGKLVGSGEQLIAAKEPQLTDKEYFALFNEQLDQDKVNQYQYKIKYVLADSICAFYGIERKDLIKIRQGKELTGRKNIKTEAVNKLFNDCLGILNTKFNIQEKAQEKQEEAKQPAQDQAKQQPVQGQGQQPQAQPAPQEKQEEAKKAEDLKEDRIEVSYSILKDNSLGSVYYKDKGAKKLSDYTPEDFGNAVLIDKDSNKVYKSFKDIFGEKYLAILNKNQKDESNENKNQEESSSEDQSNNGQSNKAQLGTSFLEIITSEPGIKILTTTELKFKGVKKEDENGITTTYGKKQISEKKAYGLKKCITSIIQSIIEKGNNENIKLKDKPTVYTEGQTIKSWIKENVIINGKPATVEDTVAKVVEILGIKNELEIEHLKNGSKNPTVLVRALESDAGLKEILKDNIKEIKNIVKEKGLKAGYAYIETLYADDNAGIKPLLTEEQQKVFENLLKTKEAVEKAENKKIEEQKIATDTIKNTGVKLLENRFKELGLYKPFDLVHPSLNESVKLIINKAKKSGIKDAIKYIPVLLENTKDGLTVDQINGLTEICKNFHIQLFILKNCFQYEEDIFKKEGDKLLKKANEDAVKQLKDGIDKIDEKLLDKKAKKEIKNEINEKSPDEIIGILNRYSVTNKVNFGNLITDYEEATITKQTKNTEILENVKKKEKETLKKVSTIVNKTVEKAKKAKEKAEAERLAKEEAERKEAAEKEASIKAYNFFSDLNKNTPEEEAEAKAKEEAEAKAKAKAEAEAEAEAERKEAEAKAKLKANESRLNRAATRLKNFGLTLLDVATIGFFHDKLFKGRE